MDQVYVVRHKVLVERRSVRRVARELGISRNTVRRYVDGAPPGVRKISPTTCLVAWRSHRGTPLQQERIASASWELAEDYVYGPHEAPGVQQCEPSATPG